MNRVALAVALSCAVFSGAIAADETCKSQADAKKLACADAEHAKAQNRRPLQYAD